MHRQPHSRQARHRSATHCNNCAELRSFNATEFLSLWLVLPLFLQDNYYDEVEREEAAMEESERQKAEAKGGV